MVLSRHLLGGSGLLMFAVFTAACGADPNGAAQADGGPSDLDPGAFDASPGAFDAGSNGGDDGGGGGITDGGVASGDGGTTSGDGGSGVFDGGSGGTDGGSGASDGGLGDVDGGLGLPDAGGGTTTTALCSSGSGQALWRLSFPNNAGGYATVEEWDNGCDYSLADQACSLSGEPHNYANWGPGVLFNSSTDYFRVRFSAAGLDFSQATLYLTAHADGSGIPNAVLESPIYGSLSFAPTVPISNHRTYAVDWSDFLSPTDSPSLTAVTLRSNPTGLAVSEIELCVE